MDEQVRPLVARAQGGDRKAFGKVYALLAPRIYGHLYYRLDGQSALAEDLTEDVFVKVIEKLGRYEDRGLPFAAWVYRIASNHLIDHLRTRPRAGTVPIEDCYDLAQAGAEEGFDRALISGELVEALGRLTEEQRQVITLRFLQDQSVADTALAMDRSQDAIKKLQARGLAALRRGLRGTALAGQAA